MLKELCRFGAVAALIAGLVLPMSTRAQTDNGFEPEAELTRLAAMPDGHRKVQQHFYFGEMSNRAGNRQNARRAYRGALDTYRRLTGNNRTLAVTFAANSALGLGAVSHLEFRDAPLRFEQYAADSAARMALLVQTREAYNDVSNIGYARATFEAVFLRAHIMQEWDTDDLANATRQLIQADEQDSLALVAAIKHTQLTMQLTRQAVMEYGRLLSLEDSLGLTNGTGDRDVSRWTGSARNNLTRLGTIIPDLLRREEALQALYAERQGTMWAAQAVPLLWDRAAQMEEEDAGLADPFFDFVLKEVLVHQGYRPFMYGPEGFRTAHDKSMRVVADSFSVGWATRRQAWASSEDDRNRQIECRLAVDGVRQLHRVPLVLDTIIQRISATADSLPAGWSTVLSGAPEAPDVQFPEIPDMGGLTAFQIQIGEGREFVDQFAQYQTRMNEISTEISTFRNLIADFRQRTSGLSADDIPPTVQRYGRLKNSLKAGKRLLIDSLTTRVMTQVDIAFDGVTDASEMLSGNRETVATELISAADESRTAANRYTREAEALGTRPPAHAKRELAGYLNEYADRLTAAAERLRGGEDTR